MTENPFFEAWNTPFELPPFDRIRPEHFPPAFDNGMAEHAAEIAGIAGAGAPPDFANTVEALERSGRLLRRVGRVFSNLTSSATNAALDAIDRDYAPRLAAHRIKIMLDPALFARVDALWRERDALGLALDQRRLLERHHLNFVRNGALLDTAQKARMAAISERLASLHTAFGQNVLHDEDEWRLVLDESDLDGLPDFARAAAAEAATERGLDGHYAITLARASVEPFLTFSARRDLRQAAEERAELAAAARADGLNAPIAPWDWRYYAEKVRLAKYAVDQAAVKPYFALDNIVEAAFDAAGRLFGVRFIERQDCPLYHPDVRAYEVRDAANRPIGLFLHDNFARPGKHSGAWMSSYREQEMLDGEILPVVVNNNNFAKGEPTLLSFDDAHTLFHEFGHGLHGLLSDVTYERVSGTAVLRDFVELPSQLFEHWLDEPEVLRRHARHYRTGAAIPQDLIDKL